MDVMPGELEKLSQIELNNINSTPGNPSGDGTRPKRVFGKNLFTHMLKRFKDLYLPRVTGERDVVEVERP